jgi:hypothetical protein
VNREEKRCMWEIRHDTRVPCCAGSGICGELTNSVELSTARDATTCAATR